MRFLDGEISLLDTGWSLTLSASGAYARPLDIPAATEAIPAAVPGTVASALESAGRFKRNEPPPLIDKDAWYRRPLAGETPGPAVLRFEGLATVAEVFLGEEVILSSDSMFESHDVAVELTGNDILSICFRALKPHLDKPGPRARWRPSLMNNQGLRLIRTTALGFMPGWAPQVHAVGPWRPVSLIRPGMHQISQLSVSAGLEEKAGVLRVGFEYDGPAADLRLACNGRETICRASEGRYSAELCLPDIEAWWPHTHGKPSLYEVTLRIARQEFLVARTGFRSVLTDRGADGKDFALLVNGEKIFCRGAVWTTADIVSLPGDRASYQPWLRAAADAGMNMIRIPGIAAYESSDFFRLCDELGIMVWQDLMFANFDYPAADPDFMIHVKSEVRQLLQAVQASPSLAILCGGSEIYQQGAMLGLPERIWKGAFWEEFLAGLAAEHCLDLPYVPNSPSGGTLPFFSNAGIAHYYGVGAYKRPLDDARRANIRFAAECLAFSNLSARGRLAGGKAGIPRDAGADWDFEDVRDHYLQVLYNVDPGRLRQEDFDRYLKLSRAVTGEVMEATFAEWRMPRSSCNGALVFTYQDVMDGPGWGVVGTDGEPKPAWHALRRAFRPVHLVFSDEGNNGLDIHILNETAKPLDAVIEVTCLRDGRVPVVSGRRALTLTARGSESLACTDLFGAFFDTSYAYRFGPPSHDVTVARLSDAETGRIVAEAFHFPLGRAKAIHEATLATILTQDGEELRLEISSDVFAQSVSIDAPGFRASDNWFHLSPDRPKVIHLVSCSNASLQPKGTVRSLGSGPVVHF
ncbi:glycoside hydrolase family 2 protein [Rhizobium deserti]|uniref:beta-mannosidase n=1 Tax=Rhizobium deserti TaxID=2547961 RepID=A0A4R5U7T0_9HYPH|nr:glycoside hydrolase family 2 protein [Rhizobium deserti]